MKVHEVPGKLEVHWDGSAKAIVDVWSSYNISLEEFRNAVLIDGLEIAKKRGAIAWIVDSSNASGNFSKEIHSFIESDVFPSFAENGIEYFITIKPDNPGLTSMTVDNYASKVGPAGIQLVEADNVEIAKDWLKSQL
ncbi:MAG: hypothetical protein BAJALOKI3v1_20018 [Promethearchaeota archaeon]|jgi:hypothetical protein|nr:MAG: hypothetical protein BAJALOKI3v1_20018 [Candidatus Lokiarchaeota archaeon]